MKKVVFETWMAFTNMNMGNILTVRLIQPPKQVAPPQISLLGREPQEWAPDPAQKGPPPQRQVADLFPGLKSTLCGQVSGLWEVEGMEIRKGKPSCDKPSLVPH